MRTAWLGMAMVAMLALGCAGLSKGKGVAQVSSEKEPGQWRMAVEDSEWAQKHTPATRGAELERRDRAVVPAMDPQPPRSPRSQRAHIAAAPSPDASGGDDYVFEEPAVAGEPAKRAHRRQAAAAKRQRAADERRRLAAAKKQRVAAARQRRASKKPRPARAGSRRVQASSKRRPRQRKLAEIDARPYRQPVYDERGQAIDDEVPDVLKD